MNINKELLKTSVERLVFITHIFFYSLKRALKSSLITELPMHSYYCSQVESIKILFLFVGREWYEHRL